MDDEELFVLFRDNGYKVTTQRLAISKFILAREDHPSAEKIYKGLSFVIFPEGTRSTDGSVGEFKRGMFVLTEKAQADIIPITLTNTINLMPRDSLKIKPGVVNLVIDKPLKPRGDKEFLQEIRSIIISNLKQVEK